MRGVMYAVCSLLRKHLPRSIFSLLIFLCSVFLVARLLGIVAVAAVRTQDLLEQDTYRK